MEYTVTENNFTISTDKSKIDIDYVHDFLTNSYWSPGVPITTVKKAMQNSLCFGVYEHDNQVGYARMVTSSSHLAKPFPR